MILEWQLVLGSFRHSRQFSINICSLLKKVIELEVADGNWPRVTRNLFLDPVFFILQVKVDSLPL